MHQHDNHRIIDCDLQVGLSTEASEHVLRVEILCPEDLAGDARKAFGHFDPLPSRWWRQYYERQRLQDVRTAPIPYTRLVNNLGSFDGRLTVAPGYAGLNRVRVRLRSDRNPLAVEVRGVGDLSHFRAKSRSLPFTQSQWLLFLVDVGSDA